MKHYFKRLIATYLGRQIKVLSKRNDFKVIAVVGSFGKTSTKFAIAQLLSATKKVQYQQGNYNDATTVPLIFFGLEQPNIYSPIAWLKTVLEIKKQLKQSYPYEYVVVELGTDGPKQIEFFEKYLMCDVAVVTAIAPEHMEYFSDIDAVANEEFSVRKFSKHLVMSADFIDQKYTRLLDITGVTYGLDESNDYVIDQTNREFRVLKQDKTVLASMLTEPSKALAYSMTAAIAVAGILGLENDQIAQGLKMVGPVNGRMNTLAGINDSVILDDTYNASPDAMKVALDTVYKMPAAKKIAILGSMNELGTYSEAAHKEVGKYCDPRQLELVVTIGTQANQFLAAEAEKRGCTVIRFDNPYSAGAYVKEHVTNKSVVLAKGSQNGVFAEEAIKMLLANSKDSVHLVRQSDQWLRKKHKSFGVGVI